MEELTVTKVMKATENMAKGACEQCGRVPETLFQFWCLFPDEGPLTKGAERALPSFCGHACWKAFVNGSQWSDRSSTRAAAGGVR